jgi:hypothetical protein
MTTRSAAQPSVDFVDGDKRNPAETQPYHEGDQTCRQDFT